MELEGEFLLQDPTNLTITPMNLALPVARLNSRIRCTGISACELHVQCTGACPGGGGPRGLAPPP